MNRERIISDRKATLAEEKQAERIRNTIEQIKDYIQNSAGDFDYAIARLEERYAVEIRLGADQFTLDFMKHMFNLDNTEGLARN